MKRLVLFLVLMVGGLPCEAQFTRQDTLRGSNGPGRDWWDVKGYNLSVQLDTTTRTIKGEVLIDFMIMRDQRDSLQLDLQDSMVISDVWIREKQDGGDWREIGHAGTKKDGNAWWVDLSGVHTRFRENRLYRLQVAFHGKPRVAKHPPWDGGLIWSRDSIGKIWVAVACQGIGASSWWPCKDYQGDEPDSMAISISRYNSFLPISNGKTYSIGMELLGKRKIDSFYEFHLKNPINTYNVTFYMGDYAHYHDTMRGEKGTLDLDFHPLKYNLKKAKKQWAVTKDMLRCFEYWMGPYPFYEDGYKLVEAPYLGMEHQSAIAYGNGYKMGYRGMDISGTGLGLEFDYIIIHESGHEWFGNNITAQDRADNWIHEGFTSYTEALYVEWIKGKEAAFRYTTGNWQRISNDEPVIAPYGVNAQGTGDQYYKGAAVVHMIRMMLNDDAKFRQLLRGLNKDFYHKIVTSKEVEAYISRFAGKDLKAFFDVYLRHTQLPVVLAKQHGDRVTLTLRSERDLKLPVYYKGRAVCELSSVPVSIPVSDLKGLLNYLVVYIPADNGTLPLLRD